MEKTSLNIRWSKVKLYIHDRTYNSWSFVDNETNDEIPKEHATHLESISPSKDKLFTKDVFELTFVDSIPQINPVYSYYKSCEYIAGVLVLDGNKTYGRTKNKKRLLYKCIPDDNRLPIFLVPYDIKIGFSKIYKNKFVIFRFDSWSNKHPEGLLLETIGDIDNLEAFYEFQLYCKNLHVSLVEFTKKTKNVLNNKTNDQFVETILENPNFQIEDRRDRHVFTIDSVHSLDFDDGFGIERIGNNWCVSVYIANVFVWLETLGLWNSFSKRVSTIYLPDRRRPMLPTILSDILCSLQKNQPRFAYVMDIMIDENGKLIGENPIQYKNVLIEVKHNYHYEDEKSLKSDIYYKWLFDISYLMDNSIKNSHHLVAHWMVQTNAFTGILLANNKTGIFRSASYIDGDLHSKNDLVSGLNGDTVRVIKMWNNTIGQYNLFDENIDSYHNLIKNKVVINNSSIFDNGQKNNLTAYIHITSPIRRLVDLLNQIILFESLGLVKNIGIDAKKFLKDWIEQMEYINTSMRYIRKIQSSCELLNYCYKDRSIMERIYKGVVFEKVRKNDGFITYMVYLEELKMMSRITVQEDIENYSYCYFNLYLFEDEEKIKRKIRLKLV